jgi:hypothetical protein
MPNAWLNHVRQFRKNNKNMSYKQLLKHAKNSYGGAPPMQQQGGIDGENPKPTPTMSATSGLQSAMQSLRSMTTGGGDGASGVTGFESRSSLTRSASSVGGRRSSRSRQSSRKTRRRRR